MADTKENLRSAFAGESQASRRYLYFAEKADKEGQPQIARLFRAASEAETAHARNHLSAAEGIKSTADNLKAAAEGEHWEFTKMYPPFIEQAKADKNRPAEVSFDYANKVEQIHHTLYQEAIKAMASGTKLKSQSYYVCQGCGNTVAGAAPDKCPICGAAKKMFKKVE